jgi:hypothetical protein
MIPEMQKHLEKLVVDLNYDMKAVLACFTTPRPISVRSPVRRSPPASPTTSPAPAAPHERRTDVGQLCHPHQSEPGHDQPPPIASRWSSASFRPRRIADSVDALSVLRTALVGLKKAAAIYGKNRERTGVQQKRYAEARTRPKSRVMTRLTRCQARPRQGRGHDQGH